MEHTPTPWTCHLSIIRKNDLLIAEALKGPNLSPYFNADFIVRAVNSHDELLEAAKFMCKVYKSLADSGDAGFWKAEDQKEYSDLMEAIQKAEGK